MSGRRNDFVNPVKQGEFIQLQQDLYYLTSGGSNLSSKLKYDCESNSYILAKILAVVMSMTIAAGFTGCTENANINSSVNDAGFGSSTENKSYTEEKTDVVVKNELNSANENHVETAYEITDWNTAGIVMQS